MNLNYRLVRNLGVSWLAFLIIGVAIGNFFPIPTITLLIDRSYCPSPQWQQLVRQYEELYQQHQNRALHIQSVVLFNDLGAEERSLPPQPEILGQLPTYGRFSRQKMAKLQQNYVRTQLMTCSQSK